MALQNCRSMSRCTAFERQVIAIEIEYSFAVRTQCGHLYGT